MTPWELAVAQAGWSQAQGAKETPEAPTAEEFKKARQASMERDKARRGG